MAAAGLLGLQMMSDVEIAWLLANQASKLTQIGGMIYGAKDFIPATPRDYLADLNDDYYRNVKYVEMPVVDIQPDLNIEKYLSEINSSYQDVNKRIVTEINDQHLTLPREYLDRVLPHGPYFNNSFETPDQVTPHDPSFNDNYTRKPTRRVCLCRRGLKKSNKVCYCKQIKKT
jgi:hypothetical protein